MIFVSNIRLKVTLTAIKGEVFVFFFEIKSSHFECSEQRLLYPGEKRHKILLMFITTVLGSLFPEDHYKGSDSSLVQ